MFQTSHWHLLHKIFLLGRNRRILIQQLLTHLKHSRDKHKKFKSSVTVWHFKVGQPISDNELSASLLCSQNQPRRALHFPCYRSGFLTGVRKNLPAQIRWNRIKMLPVGISFWLISCVLPGSFIAQQQTTNYLQFVIKMLAAYHNVEIGKNGGEIHVKYLRNWATKN